MDSSGDQANAAMTDAILADLLSAEDRFADGPVAARWQGCSEDHADGSRCEELDASVDDDLAMLLARVEAECDSPSNGNGTPSA